MVDSLIAKSLIDTELKFFLGRKADKKLVNLFNNNCVLYWEKITIHPL